jgi:hypothetical protein
VVRGAFSGDAVCIDLLHEILHALDELEKKHSSTSSELRQLTTTLLETTKTL